MMFGRMTTAYWAGTEMHKLLWGKNGLTGTWKLWEPLPLLMLPDPTVAKVSEWPHLCGSAPGELFSLYV